MNIAENIISIAKLVASISVIGSFLVGLWAFTFGPVKDFLDRFEEIDKEVKTLREDVDRATGDDRVLRQPSGMSYIEEPVRGGENVVMYLVAERTVLGTPCRLVDWVPIFTDERNVPTPGKRSHNGGVRTQIGDDLVKLRVEMIPPQVLLPGRIEVYLALEYSCNGVTVPEKSKVLAYTLLPPK